MLDMYFFGAQFKSKTATVQTTDGFEILVEPNGLIGRHIYLTGSSIVPLSKCFASFQSQATCS